MKIKSRNKIRPEFNMSSMTDLIFLLLIFFMILLTQLKQNNLINMDLPKSPATIKSPKSTVVSVDRNMVYKIDGVVVQKEQISGILRSKVTEGDKVDIAMDKSVLFEHFVDLVSIISIENPYRVGIQTDNK